MSPLAKRDLVEHTKDDLAMLIGHHLLKKRTEVIVLREALKRAYPVTYEHELEKVKKRVDELVELSQKEKNGVG